MAPLPMSVLTAGVGFSEDGEAENGMGADFRGLR